MRTECVYRQVDLSSRGARAWVLLIALAGAWTLTAQGDDVRTAAAVEELPDLAAIERAFQGVVARVSPSVVGIRALKRNYLSLTADEGDASELFEQRVVVNGSGTIVGADGLILTNEHVVQNATDIEVMLHDGARVPATVLSADSRSDLAVLAIDRDDLAVVKFCEWDHVRRGQWSVVLGNPFGLGRDGQLSVSIGVVSNLGRQLPGLGEVDDRFYHNMIQTTAAINPGNSGGPLFNVRGEMIGVITAMHTRAPADEGVGFAIPMTAARRDTVAALCAGEAIEYGYIGLTARVPNEFEVLLDDVLRSSGVVVDQVESDGPADRAQVAVGDAIMDCNGAPLRGPGHLAELVGDAPVGDHLFFTIRRDGRVLRRSVEVERRDVNRVNWLRSGSISWRGLRLADLTADARRVLQIDDAVTGIAVIEVMPESPAAAASLVIGDVIEAANGEKLAGLDDFLQVLRTQGGAIELDVSGVGQRLIEP